MGGNIKGAFHPKMGIIKDRNGRDPLDAKEIKNGKMERIHRSTAQKKSLMNWITTKVWSATQSQTFWTVMLSRP